MVVSKYENKLIEMAFVNKVWNCLLIKNSQNGKETCTTTKIE